MPPFSLIASLYYFPASAMVNIPLILSVAFFPGIVPRFFRALSSQFPSVVPYPLFPPSTILFPSLLRTPHPLPPPPFCFFSLGPLAVSPQVMFSWPDDACISLVSS